MNFGHVCITRFKLFIAILPICFSVSAAGFDTKESLQKAYIEAYEALNIKIEECSKQKKQREINITDKWLSSQPTLTQKVVLFELSKRAENRCSEPEETHYIKVTFDLAVIGETDALNEYIELKKHELPKDTNRKILAELDTKELNRLAELDKYQSPFNLFSAFDS